MGTPEEPKTIEEMPLAFARSAREAPLLIGPGSSKDSVPLLTREHVEVFNRVKGKDEAVHGTIVQITEAVRDNPELQNLHNYVREWGQVVAIDDVQGTITVELIYDEGNTQVELPLEKYSASCDYVEAYYPSDFNGTSEQFTVDPASLLKPAPESQ